MMGKKVKDNTAIFIPYPLTFSQSALNVPCLFSSSPGVSSPKEA
jgi:hypothetical protein